MAADKIALSWSASFDNQSSGSAEKYEIRYSQSPLTAENFADAEIYPHSPKPAAGGQKEYWELRDLTPDTSFYDFKVCTATGQVGFPVLWGQPFRESLVVHCSSGRP